MNRIELINQLDLVSKALADNNTIPVLQCFMFMGTKVAAYNDSIGIITPCGTNEVFAINGEILLKMLKSSSTEEITLAVADKNEVLMKSGRNTVRFPYFNKEDFIFEEPKNEKWEYKIPINEQTLNGLKACLSTTSNDDTQRGLAGVFLCPEGKTVHFYSSDGDAITRFVTDIPVNGKQVYMLSKGFCDALLKTVQSDGFLHINANWAMAELDNDFLVYGRMLENPEPIDLAKELKNTFKGKPEYCLIPKGLDEALSKARVVADRESARTVLSIEAGRIKLTTEASMGVVRDNLTFDTHKEVEAHVSSEIIQKVAAACTEMAVFENCIVFRNGDTLLQLISNMD